MQIPTQDQIAAAKADAMQRFGRDEALLVPMTSPIDFAVLVAPVDLAAYGAFADGQLSDLDTAQRNLLHARLLWPDPATVSERLNRRPAMAGKVAARLMSRAGRRAEDCDVELLADLLHRAAPGQREVMKGLPIEEAQKLIAERPTEELWAVVDVGLSLVLSAPDGDVWSMAKTREIEATRKQKGIATAVLDFAKQAIVWSAAPIDALLDDMPALSAEIRRAYMHMGGDAAEATSKSF